MIPWFKMFGHGLTKNTALPTITYPPYEDMGQVISGTVVAAGGYIWSDWIDDHEWVRFIIVNGQMDQAFDLVINRRIKETGQTGQIGTLYANNATCANNTVWRDMIVQGVSNQIGASALGGNSFRIGLKNIGASPSTFAAARLQLLG